MTKSYETTLKHEIHSHLDTLAAAGSPWVASWIAHGICNAHESGLIEGEDKEFWLHGGYSHVRKIVTKVINERAGDSINRDAPAQIELPGFERHHLQDYYIVKRDNQEQGIPVTDLTDEELAAKAEVYRSMGQACFAHAREIDRYILWRRDVQGWPVQRHANENTPSGGDGTNG